MTTLRDQIQGKEGFTREHKLNRFLYVSIDKSLINIENVLNVLKSELSSKNSTFVRCNINRLYEKTTVGFFKTHEEGYLVFDIDNEKCEQMEDRYFDYCPAYDIYVYTSLKEYYILKPVHNRDSMANNSHYQQLKIPNNWLLKS